MPQLNLAPWFMVFIMTWFMFLISLLPRANKFKLLDKPMMQQTQDKLNPWNWPWT